MRDEISSFVSANVRLRWQQQTAVRDQQLVCVRSSARAPQAKVALLFYVSVCQSVSVHVVVCRLPTCGFITCPQ